ncbi:MAG: selenide, water dikinase SelD [Myxococcales bacterium]|nr:selenide, water dikinase SelD [Myxococcales bacterium]
MVQVLKNLPVLNHRWVSPETGPLDDAAIVCPGASDGSLVLTLDVITPVVDDPRAFGQIAAANALSDVYAMGGDAQVALTFVGVPDAVPLDVLEAILLGVTEKCHEAGCAIVGGHSIRDAEPKAGLAVVGSVDPDRAWTQTRARAGQRLVLSKPIGTGVIAQAARSDRAAAESVALATRCMARLNRHAKNVGAARGATAATDVTGFGLLAHLHHVAAASKLEARLDVAAIPLLDGALDAAGAGLVPGGSKRNLRYVEPHLSGTEQIAAALLTVLADAQTSGGLLLCLPADQADAAAAEIGDGACVVGELVAGQAGRVTLA